MNNLKILLVCSAGTSTSLVVEKMQQQVERENKQYQIKACGQPLAKDYIPNYDVILLSPGLKFNLKEFVTLFPLKAIAVIKPKDYGMLDGEAIIKQAEELINIK